MGRTSGVKAGAMAALALGGAGMAAPVRAGSSAQPGQTVGLPAGAPFAVGLYFVNTSSFGIRSTEPRGTELNINLPSFIWATPWTVAGGRLQFVVLQPIAASSTRGAAYQSGFGQTLLAGQIAWTLGEHVHASYLLGAYLPSDTRIVIQNAVLHQRFAVTYNGDGLNLTAHALYGTVLETVSPLGTAYYPDFLNLDLTATKKFGKWEVGPVAFGSTDLPTRNPAYKRQGQVAVGGLVGYDFGPVNLQAYVTRDVVQSNYGGRDTRGWLRAIVPIYKDAEAAPLRPVFGR
ncbi:transporter [Methylobacterium sp. Leaf112]|uniref:transporter n=1 Tax=Methylobacterium sp. Leaf112 TaxID=1736258 RepID=UPI0007008D74|nr:CoxB-like protein [Methylobacterium sp. Leaf112]